jgi:hypothetical protein
MVWKMLDLDDLEPHENVHIEYRTMKVKIDIRERKSNPGPSMSIVSTYCQWAVDSQNVNSTWIEYKQSPDG